LAHYFYLENRFPALVLKRLIFILLIGITLPAHSQTLVINEMMSSNGQSFRDENGDSSDWIELFNPGLAAIDLAGYGLSDDSKKPFKWVFNTGTVPPHGFLIVFASGKDRQPQSATPVVPSVLPGLVGWFAADRIDLADLAHIRKAGASSFIKNWEDLSSARSDARQNADLLQPQLFSSSGENPAFVRFDGNNDQLNLSQPAGTNDFTISVVLRSPVVHEIDPESSAGVGGVSGQHYLFGATHGGDFNSGAGLSVGNNGISVYEHGSGYMPALAVYDAPLESNFNIVTITYAGKQPTISLNGNIARRGVPSPRAQVFAPITIGSGAYGSFQGDVAEILFYNRALSEFDRRNVETFLAQKYKLHLTTPFHTSFQLDAAGEIVTLTAPGGTLSDQTPSVPIPRDVSYGRKPDGAASWFFFADSSPGASNQTQGSAEYLAAPEFSRPGGFYTNAFNLGITAAGNDVVIRYTLDGSEPSTNSPIYSIPLSIHSRTGTPNTISQILTGSGWQPPASEVFKITVVRARVFQTGALPSITTTASYLIYPRQKYKLPVISLATTASNFFDPEVGIYVEGNHGNYWQRGADWERPLHIEFYETNGAQAFSSDVGVKTHGNTSRQFPQKALGIDARFGNNRKPIKYQLFKDRPQKEFESLILRQSGHDYFYTLLRDGMMQRFVEDLGVETQAWRPAIVFLNGEYWGIHDIREMEDKNFFAEHKGADPNNIDYLEGYVSVNEGDTVHYQAMLDFLSNNDIKSQANYEDLQSRMEVNNYQIYKIAEIFYYRWDIGNHRLWRPKTPEGRWRWLQFDNDVGWGGFWSVAPAWQFNMLGYDLEPNGPWTQYESSPGGNDHNSPVTTFLLRKLLENASFKHDFLNRFADMLNTTFRPDRVTGIINEMASQIEPEVSEHVNRWRAPATFSQWKANVQYLRDFATNRPPVIRQQLIQKFGLGGIANLTLSATDTNLGYIQLNTINVSAQTNYPWTGTYFKGNSVTITAVARPGARFAGWQGIYGFDTNTATFLLNGNLTVVAAFEQLQIVPGIFTSSTALKGPMLRFQGTGSPGTQYQLDASTNLLNWQPQQVLTVSSNGFFEFFDTPDLSRRFYRLLH
jgi:hypothetical protein